METVLEAGKVAFDTVTMIDAGGVDGLSKAVREAEEKRDDRMSAIVVLNFRRFDAEAAEEVRGGIEKRARNLEAQAVNVGCRVLGPEFSFSEVAAGSTGTGTLVFCVPADERFGGEGWKTFFGWLKEINRAFVKKRF